MVRCRHIRLPGVIYLLGSPAQPRRIGRGIALIVAHAVWDSMTALAGGTAAAVVVVVLRVGNFLFAVTALWIAFVWAHPREAHFVRDVLAPEVDAGVLTDDDVTAAGGWRQQRQYVKAGTDRADKKKRRHLVRAALDLCADLAVSKGLDSDRVVHSRAEIARLREGTKADPLSSDRLASN